MGYKHRSRGLLKQKYNNEENLVFPTQCHVVILL